MSKREQIMQALVTALAGTTGVGTRVFRSRSQALTRDESPSVVVMPVQEQAVEDAIGQIDARLTVQVAVYQRGNVPDSLADATVESAFAKVMADETLGGLAIDITEDGTSWDFDEADTDAVWIAMNFIVWHRHARKTLN